MIYFYTSIIISVVAIIFAGISFLNIKKRKIKDKKVKEISGVIYDGTNALFKKEYGALTFLLVLVGAFLYFVAGDYMALAFFIGAIFSIFVGNLIARINILIDSRVAEAAKISLKDCWQTVYKGISSSGIIIVGAALLGISVICLIFKETEALYGFIFGGLLVAIFIQVSGGIYKKSAETGFDLMGRIDAGLIDDNSKRSVVIAKNIGRTNIFGSGLFNNYVDAVICAIALGALGLTAEFERLFYLPFILFALLIVLAIAGSVFIRIKTNRVLSKKILNQGIFGLVFLVIIFSFLAIRFIAGDFLLFFAFLTGLVFAICLGFIIRFFTSYKYRPTQKLAISAQNGLVINIFKGFSLGVEGAAALVFIILLMVFIAYLFGGVYGIAIATLGVLSYFLISNIITSYGLMGSGGKDIVKLSELGGETKIRIEKISIFGGEPVIIKEGLALGLSFLTSLVLFFNFGLIVDLKFINIFLPKTIIGAFIGCLIPLLFSSFFLSLIAKTAAKIVQEARRQFKKSDNALAIETKPDYCRCVKCGVKSMPKDTVLPFVFVIIVPILTGIFIGKEALGGMLIGSIIAGFLLGIIMINAGTAFRNAKRYVESGNLGGEETIAHKALIIGNAVGDLFKDTALPLNILLKLMVIIALIIAPLL